MEEEQQNQGNTGKQENQENKTRIIENPINLQYKQESTQEENKAKKENILKKFKRFLIECKRVLKITKKPDKKEFKLIVKISAIGMAIIGMLGFLITFIKEIIQGSL
jgi:protein transport protein SEC61 subunit gamma and related proteins